MATYTQIDAESLTRFLYMFNLGELDSFQPISAGIENSNYFVSLENDQDFVLTITEDLDLAEVPFFNDLLQNLVNAKLPVPEPQRTLDGMASTLFKGKPTWLFSKLEGEHVTSPSDDQCFEIGLALAKIHENSKKCRYSRDNVYSADWAKQTLTQVQDRLSNEHYSTIEKVIGDYEGLDPTILPRGIVHGDLFRDNAMFVDSELTGVIDFYHACDDFYIQDIAITINDWCLDNLQLNQARQEALLSGYQQQRQLEHKEVNALPQFRTFAAMRFALTRLLAESDHPERSPGTKLALLNQLLS